MEENPMAWIAALGLSHEQLAALVEAMEPAMLRAPSYAREWTIAQVLSHLGSGAEITLGRLRAALGGEDTAEQEQMQAIWARWDAMSPDDQAANALATDRLLVERLENLNADELAAVAIEFHGHVLDACRFIGLRLGEHAVHLWDIAVTQHPAAEIDETATQLLIGSENFVRIAGVSGKAGTHNFRVGIETTGPARSFVLRVGGGAVLLEPGVVPETGDAVIELPATAFVRLVYGRLDPAHTPLFAERGAQPDLDTLRDVFRGF